MNKSSIKLVLLSILFFRTALMEEKSFDGVDIDLHEGSLIRKIVENGVVKYLKEYGGNFLIKVSSDIIQLKAYKRHGRMELNSPKLAFDHKNGNVIIQDGGLAEGGSINSQPKTIKIIIKCSKSPEFYFDLLLRDKANRVRQIFFERACVQLGKTQVAGPNMQLIFWVIIFLIIFIVIIWICKAIIVTALVTGAIYLYRRLKKKLSRKRDESEMEKLIVSAHKFEMLDEGEKIKA